MKVFSTKNEKNQLIATTLVEPNYGLMMWQYEFYVDGKLREDRLLNYAYGGLYTNLDEFRFESLDGQFLFLPTLNNHMLYSVATDSLQSIEIAPVGHSNEFVSNHFIEDRLIILHNRQFITVDMETGIQSSKLLPTNAKLVALQNKENGQWISYKKQGEQKLHLLKID